MTGWQTADQTKTGGSFFDMAGLRDLGIVWPKLTAKIPTASAQSGSADPGSGNVGAAQVPASGGLQTYARNLLAKYGWSGQWTSFNNVVNRESGWNPLSKNGTSGAYGIAQALGHGDQSTQGTNSDEYGGYGLTAAQNRAANSGDGYAQLLWMMNYIQSRYGSPDNAWAHEQQFGWY
jgi:hypothetical protein